MQSNVEVNIDTWLTDEEKYKLDHDPQYLALYIGMAFTEYYLCCYYNKIGKDDYKAAIQNLIDSSGLSKLNVKSLMWGIEKMTLRQVTQLALALGENPKDFIIGALQYGD